MKTPTTKKDGYRRSYTQMTKEDGHLPTPIAIFLFISLFLVSSFFESRDEIPFKGVGLSHLEISDSGCE
jgi:hypothetical protein